VTEQEDLLEDLVWIRQRARNCRGAIESGQITDKDVRGSLLRVTERLDAIIERLRAPAPQCAVQTDGLQSVYDALTQAQDCIIGETPEGISDEEAREDTISKVRDAMRAIEAMQSAAHAQAPLESLLREYASVLRRNSSGGDLSADEQRNNQALADYLEELIRRARRGDAK
jgi:hypothetical protein